MEINQHLEQLLLTCERIQKRLEEERCNTEIEQANNTNYQI